MWFKLAIGFATVELMGKMRVQDNIDTERWKDP